MRFVGLTQKLSESIQKISLFLLNRRSTRSWEIFSQGLPQTGLELLFFWSYPQSGCWGHLGPVKKEIWYNLLVLSPKAVSL